MNDEIMTIDLAIRLIKFILLVSLLALPIVSIAMMLSSGFRSFTWKPSRKRDRNREERVRLLGSLVEDALKKNGLK